MCFLQIFGTKTKTKAKQPQSEKEYKDIEIYTIVRYFALNIFYRLILTESLAINYCRQHVIYNDQRSYFLGRLYLIFTCSFKERAGSLPPNNKCSTVNCERN